MRSERLKQTGLSLFLIAAGLALLLFCRFTALHRGDYSLKLLLLGSVGVGWGMATVVINWRDPTTSRRLIERVTDRSTRGRQRIGPILLLVIALVVAVGAIDYLFDAWIAHDLASCRSAGTCERSAASGDVN